MLSAVKLRSVLLSLMVAVLALGFGLAQPRTADAEIGGSLPPAGTGGIALILYSGGSLDSLQAELFGQGCGAQSYWVTRDGSWVGYNLGAPSFVNAKFVALFPGEQLPANTVLLVVCVEGGVGGPGPSSQGSDPSVGRYICGPTGSQARIEITYWDYYPQVTQASSNQAFMRIEYTFPPNATATEVKPIIRTGLGWHSNAEIKKIFGVDNPLDPSGLGMVPIGVPFPQMHQSPTQSDHIRLTVDGNQHVASWDELKTFVPSKVVFEAYVRGDLLHGERPDVDFAGLAAGLGASDPYSLEEPPILLFSFRMPDGKEWQNTPQDPASCDYVIR